MSRSSWVTATWITEVRGEISVGLSSSGEAASAVSTEEARERHAFSSFCIGSTASIPAMAKNQAQVPRRANG